MQPDKLFDDLLSFSKALTNASSKEDAEKITRNFQSSNANGEIDYENGIRPFSASDARKALMGLRADMIEYDVDNLVKVGTSDPIMFKLVYDVLCEFISTVDKKLYSKWWEDWFIAETETRALTYYEQYEQFRQDTCGYGRQGMNDFYAKKQYNSRVMAFVFTLKRKVVANNVQPIIKFCEFIELPPVWSDERKIISKAIFLYAYKQYDDETINEDSYDYVY